MVDSRQAGFTVAVLCPALASWLPTLGNAVALAVAAWAFILWVDYVEAEVLMLRARGDSDEPGGHP